jgi:D-alanine-D-alanine ligase
VARIAAEVGAPLVVLPVREGSSIGVGVVADIEDVDPKGGVTAAIDEALRWDTAALVEEFLDGLEFSVIVLGAPGGGAEALLPTETVSPNPFMTYDDKYMPGRSQKITPARVDADTLARIRREAERLFVAFGFKGYARLDGFLMPDGRLLFTDPNSTSGMAPSSFMFHQAAEAGLTAGMVIERIIELAAADHRAKRGPL